jgi:hypothetical protein
VQALTVILRLVKHLKNKGELQATPPLLPQPSSQPEPRTLSGLSQPLSPPLSQPLSSPLNDLETKGGLQAVADKGLQALRAALSLSPGGVLYRRLMGWVFRTRFGSDRPGRWGLYTHSIRAYYAERFYWLLRRRYPRLVQPSGFIERDISLAFASHGYLVVNVKDLLVLYDQTRLPWLIPYIEGGLAYLRRLDWAEWLQRDHLFVELPDVLQLYNRLAAPVPPDEFQRAERALAASRQGVSLDYATDAAQAFSRPA